MAIKDIDTKCWILALFVRDDGERFLLGDGSYEFEEKQLHFVANAMANDVVEVQGNDGYLLAGQVRRPSTQSFDGYVGDSSTSKAMVEERRRAFFAFFRKNHFYKVIYVFPDGSAIQRKRGFLVDAPEVKELWQIYPKYHVALNFEDINYYYYDEDADGEEIYGKSATINLNSVAQSGGLVWLMPTEVSVSGEGIEFTLAGTITGTELTSTELKGDTYQQSYSGKNLMPVANALGPSTRDLQYQISLSSGSYTISFDLDQFELGTNTSFNVMAQFRNSSGTYFVDLTLCTIDSSTTTGRKTLSFTTIDSASGDQASNIRIPVTAYNNGARATLSNIQIEVGSTATSYEPYVGGIPAPNPDYPQVVQTATGRQVVAISDGGSQSQEYEVNLGKNLFDSTTVTADRYLSDTGSLLDNAGWAASDYIPIQPNTAYTTSTVTGYGLGNLPARCYYDATKTFISGVSHANANPFTNTSPAGAYYMRESVSKANVDAMQVEKGSTATSYAPYFTPIELCKIGNYQDRIYKSGSDWYLHKATGKAVLDGSGTWYRQTTSGGVNYRFSVRVSDIEQAVTGVVGYSDKLIPVTTDTYSQDGISGTSSAQRISIRYDSIFGQMTLDEAKDWLAANPITAYYRLSTPTDTQITNTALIEQLNALAAATTYNGSTTFTMGGNGNLAAILAVEVEAVGGGGVEWDENGAVWEEGKPSYSIISIDSIDNVYPVLTITGRTVDPILTDVTTGMVFKYSGTITKSQVLKIDMFNKMATLNGTSVVGNVTGDWLYLAPGNNRITYTADNADAPNATIEWQEIVG